MAKKYDGQELFDDSTESRNAEKRLKQAPSKVPHRNRTSTVLSVVLMIIWTFVSLVASQYAIGLIMVTILGDEIDEPVYTALYSLLSYSVAMILVLFVPPLVAKKWNINKDIIAHKRADREMLGLKGLPTWTDIGLSPIAYILSTLLAMALEYLFSVFPWYSIDEVQDVGFNFIPSAGDKVVAFLVLVVLAPIVEEIIFRGWLYGKMRTKLSAPWSILIVSVLFGIVHFQWNVGVNVFALSVVLCVLREITGSIYAGILTHMIKNGVAFYLLYILVV